METFTVFCTNLKELIITDKYSIFIIFVTNNKQLPKTYTNIQSPIHKEKVLCLPSLCILSMSPHIYTIKKGDQGIPIFCHK